MPVRICRVLKLNGTPRTFRVRHKGSSDTSSKRTVKRTKTLKVGELHSELLVATDGRLHELLDIRKDKSGMIILLLTKGNSFCVAEDAQLRKGRVSWTHSTDYSSIELAQKAFASSVCREQNPSREVNDGLKSPGRKSRSR